MKKYITSDDRERIINKLVDDKFNSTIKELKVSVGVALQNALIELLPDYIKEYVLPTSDDIIKSYFNCYNGCNVYAWYSNSFFLSKARSAEDRVNIATLINYLKQLNSLCFSFERHIPFIGQQNSIFLDAFLSSEDVREVFYKYCDILLSKQTLYNKLDCLLKSKRFTAEMLKNEFPEAFKVYSNLPNGQPYSAYDNLCDNVENVRAILNSNKK